MKQIEFKLTRPVRLAPISGNTDVTVRTSGDVLISECECTDHRQRSIPITSTKRATLYRSPMGLNHTVKIILPCDMATEHEFQRQLTMLFSRLWRDFLFHFALCAIAFTFRRDA